MSDYPLHDQLLARMTERDIAQAFYDHLTMTLGFQLAQAGAWTDIDCEACEGRGWNYAQAGLSDMHERCPRCYRGRVETWLPGAQGGYDLVDVGALGWTADRLIGSFMGIDAEELANEKDRMYRDLVAAHREEHHVDADPVPPADPPGAAR